MPADELRQRGVPHPMIEAWNVVGTPDPDEFPKKLQPGQPLGDLSPEAVLDQFKPLILSRLKYFGVADDEDALSAARVGLLNARASYDPAVDDSVGWYAKAYFYIDNEIKNVIYGGDADAWSHKKVDGDEDVTIRGKESDDGGESDGKSWSIIPTTDLPDQIADAIDRATDKIGRLHRSRIPFWVQAWADQTHVRREFGPREEDWMDLPATPQEMAKALAKIPADKVGRALGAYGAVRKIAGEIETKRPIRHPERLPETPDDDGLGDWRTCRDFLIQENGASSFMLYYRAAKKDLGHPANYPLLHDVHTLAQSKPFGMQIWDWCARDLSEVMRGVLYQHISDPVYQKETRIKIWKEIGADITKVIKAA